jgi:PAS domain S-box-containing protein
MRDDRSFQERFAGIYKFSKEAIGYASLDGVLIDVNDSYTKLTGYSKEELIFRKKYQDLTPEEYHEFEVQIVEKILATGEPIEYEKEFIRKDGSRVPILLTVFLVRDSNSNPVAFTAIINYITERKRIEQADSA